MIWLLPLSVTLSPATLSSFSMFQSHWPFYPLTHLSQGICACWVFFCLECFFPWLCMVIFLSIKASTLLWSLLKGLCWPHFTTTKPYFIFFIVLRVLQITFIYLYVCCCSPHLLKCKPLKMESCFSFYPVHQCSEQCLMQNRAWGYQMCGDWLTCSLIS